MPCVNEYCGKTRFQFIGRDLGNASVCAFAVLSKNRITNIRSLFIRIEHRIQKIQNILDVLYILLKTTLQYILFLQYKPKKLLQKCFLDPLPQQLHLLEPVGSADPVLAYLLLNRPCHLLLRQ